jgi:hypothetical protein
MLDDGVGAHEQLFRDLAAPRLRLGLTGSIDAGGGFGNGSIERSKFGVVKRGLGIELV